LSHINIVFQTATLLKYIYLSFLQIQTQRPQKVGERACFETSSVIYIKFYFIILLPPLNEWLYELV